MAEILFVFVASGLFQRARRFVCSISLQSSEGRMLMMLASRASLKNTCWKNTWFEEHKFVSIIENLLGGCLEQRINTYKPTCLCGHRGLSFRARTFRQKQQLNLLV